MRFFARRGIELAQGLTGARACIDGVGGHGSARLHAELGPKLLKRNRAARFAHCGLGLGGVFSVLGRAKCFEHRLGDDGGYPLAADREMGDDAMAGQLNGRADRKVPRWLAHKADCVAQKVQALLPAMWWTWHGSRPGFRSCMMCARPCGS
jgi:hypothetical protein